MLWFPPVSFSFLLDLFHFQLEGFAQVGTRIGESLTFAVPGDVLASFQGRCASWLGDRLSITATTTTCQRPQRYLPQRAAQICAADVAEAAAPSIGMRWQWCRVQTRMENCPIRHASVNTDTSLPFRSFRERARERARASRVFPGLETAFRNYGHTPCLYIHTVQSCQGGIPPRHPPIT